MTEERKQFATRLKKFDLPDDHAVIVLMQETNEQWEFSNAPFMMVETFVNHFAGQDNE